MFCAESLTGPETVTNCVPFIFLVYSRFSISRRKRRSLEMPFRKFGKKYKRKGGKVTRKYSRKTRTRRTTLYKGKGKKYHLTRPASRVVSGVFEPDGSFTSPSLQRTIQRHMAEVENAERREVLRQVMTGEMVTNEKAAPVPVSTWTIPGVLDRLAKGTTATLNLAKKIGPIATQMVDWSELYGGYGVVGAGITAAGGQPDQAERFIEYAMETAAPTHAAIAGTLALAGAFLHRPIAAVGDYLRRHGRRTAMQAATMIGAGLAARALYIGHGRIIDYNLHLSFFRREIPRRWDSWTTAADQQQVRFSKPLRNGNPKHGHAQQRRACVSP